MLQPRLSPTDAFRLLTRSAYRRAPPIDALRLPTRSAYRRVPPTDALRLSTRFAYRRAPSTDVLRLPTSSAYRLAHSTETALLKILNDVYQSSGSKNVTLLEVLDISATFDTVDIPTIVRRLEHSFDVAGIYYNSEIKRYLSNPAQFVKVGKARSLPEPCNFGVPQGSVLGPFLFTLYVAPLAIDIVSLDNEFHQHADDTRLYIAFNQ